MRNAYKRINMITGEIEDCTATFSGEVDFLRSLNFWNNSQSPTLMKWKYYGFWSPEVPTPTRFLHHDAPIFSVQY